MSSNNATAPNSFETLIDRLYARAKREPDHVVFRFHDGQGRVKGSYASAELITAMESMSGFLTHKCGLKAGDTALLVYPPSLDFIVALLGCLRAGVVPAPVYPPNPFKLEQGLETFAPISENCGARVALTNRLYARSRRVGQVRSFIKGGGKMPAHLKWVSTDAVKPGRYTPPARPQIDGDSLALLQYTSGSTSNPKGVMITHGNLVHQVDFNRDALQLGPDARLVAWVPQYHDFGLISGILSVSGGNGALNLFSPLDYITNPGLWFELMTRYKATHTAAPNFSYELAARKTTPEQRAKWDLSHTLVAMNAAEPVRETTLQRFRDAFAVSGFPPQAFNPAYGLAEHTVGVTVGGTGVLRVARAALEAGQVREAAADDAEALTLMGCGRPMGDIKVRIVDPESREALAADQVGEVWCDSPSKAAGYLGLPEQSTEAFHAQIVDTPGAWLRTGDMGFLHDGELYICGRLKDMLILQGRNLYPQDIEDCARTAHPRIRPGGLAAFIVEHIGDDAADELIVFAEVRDGRPDAQVAQEIATAVHAAVRRGCNVGCAQVVIGPPGLVLKTTSGKLRRRACKSRWAAGDTNAWHVERFAGEAVDHEALASAAYVAAIDTDLPLVDLILNCAAELMGLAGPEALDADVPLFVQGLNSILAVDLCAQIGEHVGRPIPVLVLFRHPSAQALAAALTNQKDQQSEALVEVVDPAVRCAAGDTVLIVGGGPAGITAAGELIAKGLRVVLLEREAHVGGKVVAEHVDGRAYELGQILFFPAYHRILERIAEHGLDLAAGVLRPCDMTVDGISTQISGDETTEWCRLAFAAANHTPDPTEAMRNLPDPLKMSIAEWSESVGLPPIPLGVQFLWSGFGYGHLDSPVPAAYLLATMAILDGNFLIAQLESDNAHLWELEVARLEETGNLTVRTQVDVAEITPASSPGDLVQVALADGETLEAPVVVVAVPPDVINDILPDSHPAHRHMGTFRTFEYVITIATMDAPDWPVHGTISENMSAKRAGHLMDFQRQHLDTDVFTLSQYGHDPAGGRYTDEELLAVLKADVERAGGVLGEVHTVRRWTYFPHLPPEALAADTLGTLDKLQGAQGVLLAGSYLNMETLEHTVAETERMVRERVAVSAPTDAFTAVMADPVFAPFAKAALDQASPPQLELGPWLVRAATPNDWAEVDRLDREEYGWLGEDAVEGEASVKHQIALLNGGPSQWLWVLERDGLMVGWYVLLPTSIDPTTFKSWADATDSGRLTGTFDPAGKSLYLVAAGITSSQSKTAHDLMVINAVRLMRAHAMHTLFCCLSMPGFAGEHARSNISPEDYIQRVGADGTPRDPMMAFFHQSWPGAHRPPSLLRDGYPPDKFSGGHGVRTVSDIADHDAELRKMLSRLMARRATLDV